MRSCGVAALASDAKSGLRAPAAGLHAGLRQPDDEALRAEGFERYETPSPFVNFIGGCWQRSDASAQCVDVALRVLPEHCNTHGTLHGGMALVLADQVLAMTSKLLTRRNGVTMHVDADLLASAPRGALVTGRARILRQTGSSAFVEAHLYGRMDAAEGAGTLGSSGEDGSNGTDGIGAHGGAGSGSPSENGPMILRCSGVVRLLEALGD